ncbi:MAG TPA: universal stress protein [Fimbriimonadaceae bacterium]|nr:universal stress protein [Fimbriimonadaceae bacterium]
MKVLLGTDGSIYSRLAEVVVEKLLPPDASVTVVMSVPAPNLMATALEPISPFAAAEQATEAWDEGKRAAADIAADAAQRLAEKGLQTESLVLEGDPVANIRHFAEENGYDLIAIGSHGQTGLLSLLMGSVAKGLAHEAPCSVLIARIDQEAEPEAALQSLKAKAGLRIVLGYDGTDGARHALARTRALASGCERIIVVVAEPVDAIPAGIDPEIFARTYEYDRERGDQLASNAVAELQGLCPDVRGETDLGRGAEVLTQKAREHAADLIILGSGRHGAVERFLLGSVSSAVVGSAPCAVLLVRERIADIQSP